MLVESSCQAGWPDVKPFDFWAPSCQLHAVSFGKCLASPHALSPGSSED